MSSTFTTQHLATRYAKWSDFERKHLILSLNLDKFVSLPNELPCWKPKEGSARQLIVTTATSWGMSPDGAEKFSPCVSHSYQKTLF